MPRLLPALLLLPLVLAWCSAIVSGGERHPLGPYRSGRSVTLATHGMVATSHPLAAQIGLDILKAGGNAVDAAIAVNAALGLMEPMSCGIGGDLYALVWDAKTEKLHGLNASGRSPHKATRDFFARRKLADIPDTGPLELVSARLRRWLGRPAPPLRQGSVGQPARAQHPLRRGRLPRYRGHRRLVARRRDHARGHPGRRPAPTSAPARRLVPATSSRTPHWHAPIAPSPTRAATPFTRAGSPGKIVAFAEKNGGLFSMKDFAEHTSTWVEPVKTSYRGHDVWEIPPPGQGIAVLQMLNILEGYDLKKRGPRDAGLLAPADRSQEAGLRRSGALLCRPGIRQACPRPS